MRDGLRPRSGGGDPHVRDGMRRRLSQELLDTLPPDDRSAIRSRRDLVRINALMGNARMISEAIKDATPIRVLDLGAG